MKKTFKRLHVSEQSLLLFKWFFTYLVSYLIVFTNKLSGGEFKALALMAIVFGVKAAQDTFLKHQKDKKRNSNGETTLRYTEKIRETEKARLLFVNNTEIWVAKSISTIDEENKYITAPRFVFEAKEG